MEPKVHLVVESVDITPAPVAVDSVTPPHCTVTLGRTLPGGEVEFVEVVEVPEAVAVALDRLRQSLRG